MSSAITTSIAVDAALVQSATYRFTPADRQYLDDQIRGCQQHLVDSVLSGMQCTWVDLDSASAAVVAGDLGCSALDPLSPRKVTKVGVGSIGAARAVFCVFLTACAPGGRTRVAIGGRVPRSITGLAAAGGYAIAVPATGRVAAVGSLTPGDYPVGTIDNVGTLTFRSDLVVTGGGLGGESHTLYVDTGGNDATAQKGNQAAPYEHIQTALNAMVSGDVVLVGPGTYSETIVLPELGNITLESTSGSSETIITSAAAGATLTAQPAATALQSLTLKGFTVTNTGAGKAIALVGDSVAPNAGIFITGRLVMRDVFTLSGDGTIISCAGTLDLHDCPLYGGLSFEEVNSATVTSCTINGTANADYDHTSTLPVGAPGPQRYQFIGCSMATFTPKGSAQVEAWGCKATTTTCTFTENGATEGTLKGDSDFGTVTINATSNEAVSSADLRNSRMTALTVSSTAGALRISVDARGAVVTGTATANNLADINLRGGEYGALACAGNGTIDRSSWVEVFNAIAGDTTVTFAVPLPTGATYGISFGMVGATGDPFFKNRTEAGFDVTCAAALGAGNFATITRY